MKKLNKEAWALLNEDERVSISLKLGHGKSTWEAGEVMKKAHYKFLEIEARARHFVKLFTEHLELYDKIIPDYIPLEPRFKDYLTYTIEKRMTIGEAVQLINDKKFSIKSLREEVIIAELAKLIKSKHAIETNFAVFIFEFDRWNNFRILPMSIQEPSAFKRRNKKNDQRNIRNLLQLNSYTIEKLKERYRTKDKANCLWLPIPSMYDGKIGYGVCRVRKDEQCIEALSKVGFYLFYKKEEAVKFYDLILGYYSGDTRACRDGQKFWPEFRQLSNKANNHNAINRRIASRKYLETALRGLELNTF